MDPLLVGICFLLLFWWFIKGDFITGLIFVIFYTAWFLDDEPKETEVTPVPVIQEVKKEEPKFNSNPEIIKLNTEEKCVNSGGIWMYDECIK